ncbi:MAG: hypothetical protein IPO80_04975 [Propionibacteriaceae bacterium]|nr:hypothetical protein [Propionibacteriaceae bacterium]
MRYSSQRDRVVAGLGERGVTVRAVDRGSIKAGQPVVMTMHRAKGTEFSKVLLFGVNEGSIPGPARANYSRRPPPTRYCANDRCCRGGYPGEG